MLNIKRENLDKSKVRLTVNIPPELMTGYFQKVYDKLAPSVEVKGFRPGKAPRNLTIMQIGENRLNSEIIDTALKETYPKALEQEKLLPIGPPKINLSKMVDLSGKTAEIEYIVEIELLPEVKIGDYKKLKVESRKSRVEALKEEIDQVLSHLRRQHAKFNDVNRACKEGDRIEMDFEGKERGVIIENLTSKNYPVILGSKVLIPDFEKNIIGMKKGEEKDFKVDLGKKDIDQKSMPQKLIDFHVKMNNVQEVILPELDDELAKKFQKDTLNELKKAIEEDVKKQKAIAEKQKQENELVEKLLKMTKVDVPQSLIEQETDRMISDLKERTKMAGIPYEQYLAQLKKSEDDLKNNMKEQAERTIKIGLILGEIGKKEVKNWKIDLRDKDAGRIIMEKLLENAAK